MPILFGQLFMFAVILIDLVSLSHAQSHGLFQWGFTNEALATSIPTCSPLGIVVKSANVTTNATNGTPPYYMISFAVGATPQTTFIGTDENNLSWTVTQAVGSQLVLSVVDADGSAGGVPPQILTVIPGQTTSCVVTPQTTPPFTVTANVTDELTTCQPWGLTVKGGAPPYNVTLLQPNSPVVTNVTMPFGLDTFTFIDRANTNNRLVAAVSDVTGRWALGTPIVTTTGSNDTDCVGLVSSSGNSTIIQQQEEAAKAASQSEERHHAVVIAVVVTFLLLFLIGLGVSAFYYLRKRRQQAEAEEAQTLPTQFIGNETKMLSINNYLESSSNSSPMSRKAALVLQEAQYSRSELSSPAESSPTATLVALPYSGGNGVPTARPSSNSGFATFPTSSIRRSAKLLEAGEASSSGAVRRPPVIITRGDSEEVVIQHEDAGSVREIPPPYTDQTRSGRHNSS